MRKMTNHTEMRQFEVEDTLYPYIVSALETEKVSNYSLFRKNNKHTLLADCSKRKMNKCIRRARLKEKSERTGITHLSRDDIYTSKSGIIPETEAFWFKQAIL